MMERVNLYEKRHCILEMKGILRYSPVKSWVGMEGDKFLSRLENIQCQDTLHHARKCIDLFNDMWCKEIINRIQNKC